MGNQGAPSKGCEECRARKIGCDGRKPFCGQCRKGARQCPGYRNQLDLLFRHQSANAAQKPLTRRKRRGGKISPANSDGTTKPVVPVPNSRGQLSHQRANDSILGSMIPSPIETMAACFFAQNYAWPDSRGSSGLIWVPSKFSTSIQHETPISWCIESVGLVGISNSRAGNSVSEDYLLKMARRRYGQALDWTKQALQDPLTAKSDEALMVVMLLGFFEAMSRSNFHTTESWSAHLQGATALMKLRGSEFLNSEFGRLMYAQIKAQVIQYSLQRRMEVPELFARPARKETAGIALRPNMPANAIAELDIEFCALRAAEMRLTDGDSIISTLFNLDAKMAQWSVNLPSSWVYSTHTLDQPIDDVWQRFYHSYPTYGQARIWNKSRSSRILVNDMLLEHLQAAALFDVCSEDFYGPQRLHAEEVLLEMASHICASVPFVLGDLEGAELGHDRSSIGNGYGILWPLYVAGGMSIASPSLRNWVIAQLYRIRGRLGVKPAESLIQALKEKQ